METAYCEMCETPDLCRRTCLREFLGDEDDISDGEELREVEDTDADTMPPGLLKHLIQS